MAALLDRLDEELDFAQAHGAVGIYMCGLECDRMLSDPYFFPVYEAAQARNLPICIHSATNSPTMHEFYHQYHQLHDAFFGWSIVYWPAYGGSFLGSGWHDHQA